MPITLNQIERYLENKNVWLVGASRDAKAFSNVIIKELNERIRGLSGESERRHNPRNESI